MTDTSSPTPSGHLAFLHRRPFWTFICISVLAYGFGILTLHLLSSSFDTGRLITDIHIASGALFWGLLGGTVLDSFISAHLFLLGYYILLVFLLWRTFAKPRVEVKYPIIFTIVMLVGYYFTAAYMNGL